VRLDTHADPLDRLLTADTVLAKLPVAVAVVA
jgi:PIN domain nuclease of toxin-antitoxin system